MIENIFLVDDDLRGALDENAELAQMKPNACVDKIKSVQDQPELIPNSTLSPVNRREAVLLTEDESNAIISMTFELMKNGFHKPQPSKSLLIRLAVQNLIEDWDTETGRDGIEKRLRRLLREKSQRMNRY